MVIILVNGPEFKPWMRMFAFQLWYSNSSRRRKTLNLNLLKCA